MRLILLYYRTNATERILKITATRAASLELQPAPQFGDVFGPVPLPSLFTLPAAMSLHCALYAQVYSSVIGGVPPVQTPLVISTRNRKVRRVNGQTHKLAVVRKPRHTCSGRAMRDHSSTLTLQFLKISN